MMTTNDVTTQPEVTTTDVVEDTDSNTCDIVDSTDDETNVVALAVPQIDVLECMTKLITDIRANEDFDPRKAIVLLLDENEQIGIFGYGSIHNAHQTVGILEQAKFAILAPPSIQGK